MHNRCRLRMPIKLLPHNFHLLNISKIEKNNFFQSFSRKYWVKKQKVSERARFDQYADIIWSWYIEKRQNFVVLNVKRSLFILLNGDYGISRFSNFDRFGSFKKCYISHFLVLTKRWLRNTYHITQTQNFKFDIFSDLVTLDNFDLTQGHQRLARVHRSIPDTIQAVSSGLV